MRAAVPPTAQPAPVVAGCGDSDAPRTTRVVSAVDGSIESPTDFRFTGVGG